MDKPLVSVIVPVYNCERYLGFGIQSILEQDYHPFEVIVVDDGSTDNSGNIARSFKEVHYIYQPNQGVAVARNVGIAAAQGEFIAFLDADDLWAPNKLSVQVDYLLKNPQVGYTLVKMHNFLEPGVRWPSWLGEEVSEADEYCYSLSTLVVRKSVFDEIGVFDPRFRIGEDTDWLIHAKVAGVPMAILPHVLVQRRIHGSNLCYNYDKPGVRLHTRMKALKASIDRKRNQKTKVNNMKNNDNEK
jgi:glycosyltransferase involved in cell wall biosynthesis